MTCPFCGLDPYEYVDVGVGGRGVAVAVNCCEFGPMVFDDRSPDGQWRKLADRILDELEDVPFGEERMARATNIFHRLHSVQS